MAACAADKGLEFCGECEEYPCEELKQFQAERPHRIELWESQERIAKSDFLNGLKKWWTIIPALNAEPSIPPMIRSVGPVEQNQAADMSRCTELKLMRHLPDRNNSGLT